MATGRLSDMRHVLIVTGLLAITGGAIFSFAVPHWYFARLTLAGPASILRCTDERVTEDGSEVPFEERNELAFAML